ncbi:MAG TPA: vWA domain-containing protein, partial [Tepidisphaeraceae bacterium]|nr:vWA domain-containing protein [Tepidisphaeraceae bacterium]
DLLSIVNDKNHGTRAKFVLKAAGADLKLDESAEAFRKWWKDNKAQFAKQKPEASGWKSLRPQYIDATTDPVSIDPDDKKWYGQLELGALGLQDFDFAITIDCSRSMAGELERVKRDLLVMYTALGQIAQHPRLAITGFACAGETRTVVKLTGNKDELLSGVKKLELFGPIGEEEWAGGIDLCIKSNTWRPASDKSRRVIVLITDEPMTPAQQEKSMPIVKQAAKDGFRIHAVLIFRLENPPDPFKDDSDDASIPNMPRLRAARLRAANRGPHGIAVYDDLVESTGGQAIITLVPQGALGLGTAQKWSGGPMRMSTPVGPSDVAPIYPKGGPTAQVLSLVLADAINPQYAERIEPLVEILTAYCQRVAWIPESR